MGGLIRLTCVANQVLWRECFWNKASRRVGSVSCRHRQSRRQGTSAHVRELNKARNEGGRGAGGMCHDVWAQKIGLHERRWTATRMLSGQANDYSLPALRGRWPAIAVACDQGLVRGAES